MKKKLLHIVLCLGYGGLEKIVYDFSRELNIKDYEVHVVALEKGGPIGDQLRQEGIPVYVLGKRPGKFDVRLLIKLVKLIKKLNIQIIHSHSGCIMYAALAGKLADVPTIVHTEHGRYLPDTIGRIWEDRIFSRLINKYVCVSQELEEYMRSVVRVPPDRLVTILNGIDTAHYYRYNRHHILKLRDEYNIPLNDVVLGTVSRLTAMKNVGFLIDWMKDNIVSHQDLRLVIVGDGNQYTKLVESAKELPTGRVQFLGVRDDIPDVLNLFDIFVLPSTTEGTSLTILEAMSTQLSVIASDVGGNKNIIDHGETGFLFECNNKDAFTKCVNKLISDSVVRKKIGLGAWASVKQKYSFETMLKSYRMLYG